MFCVKRWLELFFCVLPLSAVDTSWIAWKWRNYTTKGVRRVLGILSMNGGWLLLGELGYHVYDMSREGVDLV